MPATVDANARLLVTGASGQLGQLIIAHLLDTLKVSPSNIVAGSRNPDKLTALAARGVLTRRLDFDDAASVETAAQGVDRALIISTHEVYERVKGHKAAVSALVAAGVKHILYTSILNAENATALIAQDHRDTEAFIRESKVPGYTFLRNSIYFDNQSAWIAASHRVGKWASAAKDGKLAYIARDDVALANATALASDNYENTIYEISGKVGLTVDELVNNVSKITGKTIVAAHVSEQELAKSIEASTGAPEALAKIFATYDVQTAAGLSGPVREDFKKLTGRDPLTHDEWVVLHKELLLAQ